MNHTYTVRRARDFGAGENILTTEDISEVRKTILLEMDSFLYYGVSGYILILEDGQVVKVINVSGATFPILEK
jgi:hypothetical protein